VEAGLKRPKKWPGEISTFFAGVVLKTSGSVQRHQEQSVVPVEARVFDRLYLGLARIGP
jgi:hypothetical protein